MSTWSNWLPCPPFLHLCSSSHSKRPNWDSNLGDVGSALTHSGLPPTSWLGDLLGQGRTLYSVVRDAKIVLDVNKTRQIAQEIVKGMGYLHAKGILHKDLKSKNVFYDNGKVVITDFGLFSISGVLQAGRISCSVTQAEMQQCNHGSLQPQPPRLKRSSHLSLPRCWAHRGATMPSWALLFNGSLQKLL
ncbi:Kinase suppressor of Ras 2 [Plecturocebus cupreus]